MIPTACSAFRRGDIENVRFNEECLGGGYEDTLFFDNLRTACQMKKKGTTIVINNDVMVTHLNEAKEGFGSPVTKYNKQVYITNAILVRK